VVRTLQDKKASEERALDSQNRRLEVGLKSSISDKNALLLRKKFQQLHHKDPGELRLLKFYLLSLPAFQRAPQWLEDSLAEVFVDPVVELSSSTNSLAFFYGNPSGMSALEKTFLPGVTDQEALAAMDALSMVLECPLEELQVYSGRQILFLEAEKRGLKAEELQRFSHEVFMNPLVERHVFLSGDALQGKERFKKFTMPRVRIDATLGGFELFETSPEKSSLKKLSKDRHLALSNHEIKAIQSKFQDEEFIEERKAVGLGAQITDAELECIAQTWSEHCKHKIFNAQIEFVDEDQPENNRFIEGLFPTYIRSVTKTLEKEKGDFLVSTFVDNSGIIQFDDEYNVCFKVETHNSPSALDPYGGALTGIVGVNRDILGTGLGAKPVLNTDILCFGPPAWSEEVPPGLMHPDRIREGVIQGIEDGGNQSGIPTVNGSVHFHESYLGKPLVFCGTAGILPKKAKGLNCAEKYVRPQDRILMVGGRVGKDGIHGATFSSEGLGEDIPLGAVQIGDPFTQKKMTDFLLVARDRGIISGITDNGAGGLSSSVGEMALFTSGAEIDLSKAILKYQGLEPWEILVSESQERMTVAVRPHDLEQFESLAKDFDVEICDLGSFTTSGVFHVLYGEKTVAWLPLDFLHDACPKMRLKAIWQSSEREASVVQAENTRSPEEMKSLFLEMLSDPNVSTREALIRRFDHEVQGSSVLKPLVGKFLNAPSDAAVLRPLPDREKGLVVSHGIHPWLSERAPKLMGAYVVDEAVRNAVATGGNIRSMALLDNFSWPDPVQHPDQNPDGCRKCAQLVLACEGFSEAALAYRLPIISGKDSMKNDYIFPKDHEKEGEKISVMPTLLASLIGIVDHPSHGVSSDLKKDGNLLYEVGGRGRGLGASLFERVEGLRKAYSLFEIDFDKNVETYKDMARMIESGIIRSAHDISDGGLLAAIAEMALGGEVGAKVELSLYERDLLDELFSEAPGRFVVEVDPDDSENFEKSLSNSPWRRIGLVGGADLLVGSNLSDPKERQWLNVSIEEIKKAHGGGVFRWP
jgi:phosphoribosylformylglycinamidine synthase